MQALRSRFVLALLLCAAAAGCAHKKPLLRWEPQPPAATVEGAVRVGAVRNLRAPEYGSDNPDLLGYSRNGPGLIAGKRHWDLPYLSTDAETYVPSTVEAAVRSLVEDSLFAAGIAARSEHPNAEISVDLRALWVDGWSGLGGSFGANGEMELVISDLQGHELRRLPVKSHGHTAMGAHREALEEVMNGFQKSMIAAFREPATREALLEPDKVARQSPGVPKPVPASATSGKSDAVARLKQLKQMRDDGLITEEDYQKKKKEILDSM